MQRKAEEDQAAHAFEGRLRLRLRGHAPAERLAAGEQGQVRGSPPGGGHGCADGGVGYGGRIHPLTPKLHIRELKAQRGHVVGAQALGDGRHRAVVHAGAGAMRQNQTSARRLGRDPEAGNRRIFAQRY
jgi:hypothetical protein